MQSSGIAIFLAAAIIGVSIVAGSFLVRTSIDRTAQEVAGLKVAVAKLETAQAAPAPRQAARTRPDPSKRYSIDTKGSPARGGDDAKVVIVEFSDFQCPFCARVSPTMKRIEEKFGDEVRIVFKHLPLRTHHKAPAAHAAAEAAHRQEKFWEMHNRIFADQSSMSPEKYQEYAREIGLDMEKFEKDVASASVKKTVDGDAAEAARLGVTGTPSFFINGRFLSGAKPFESFEALIDAELGRS